MKTNQLSSVHKAIRILKAFTQEEPELGISELSKRFGLAKSTVSRLIQILCEENLVQRNEETRKYHLSLGAFEIGSVVYHEIEVAQVALPLLKQMLDKVRGVIQMVTYDKGEIVYLIRLPEDRDSKVINTMGKRLPSHCTAAGKVLLAYQDEQEIAHYLQKDLNAFTERTITSKEDLWNELIKIRRKGYALSHGEFRTGVSSVSVPVYDEFDRVVVALSVTRPTELMSSGQVERVKGEMEIYSRLISESLGMIS
ncbi:IclR family transcriptional regulator [Halalkalibacterium ligniniphilum]|uniref:IclR family transcriptional regulator n=1 Tax=Halalkalibacterium ligniniphilum TaxID=1134413 RepID=UPI00034AF674|nr:IclR family transcriptional regulator [Halalkalibacterium ligniniphilum]